MLDGVASTETATCCHSSNLSGDVEDLACTQSVDLNMRGTNIRAPLTWSPQHPGPAPSGHAMATAQPKGLETSDRAAAMY